MMIRFSVAHSAAGEGQLSQQEPLKGFTRFSFYSWQMDQKILRNHWDPFQAFFAIKKSVWRDLQNCCVLCRQCLLKRASKTKLSKYLSILMNGTAQNDSWNAWKVFHFKVFCHKKKTQVTFRLRYFNVSASVDIKFITEQFICLGDLFPSPVQSVPTQYFWQQTNGHLLISCLLGATVPEH